MKIHLQMSIFILLHFPTLVGTCLNPMITWPPLNLFSLLCPNFGYKPNVKVITNVHVMKNTPKGGKKQAPHLTLKGTNKHLHIIEKINGKKIEIID